MPRLGARLPLCLPVHPKPEILVARGRGGPGGGGRPSARRAQCRAASSHVDLLSLAFAPLAPRRAPVSPSPRAPRPRARVGALASSPRAPPPRARSRGRPPRRRSRASSSSTPSRRGSAVAASPAASPPPLPLLPSRAALDAFLASASLDEVCSAALAVRALGPDPLVVTFSPKVFVPLTRACRDACGYCTFAADPAASARVYMTVDEVVAVAERGRVAGATECLFTLGDRPEARYEAATRELAALGFASTVDYLAHCAEVVMTRTGLIPHCNAGVLTKRELARLRQVSASQGLMLESTAERLMGTGADRGDDGSDRGDDGSDFFGDANWDAPHRGCESKRPAVRLEVLRRAGELRVPFTSGVLVGIGETRAERLDALFAIRAANEAGGGHIGEVIVQNFRAKEGTRMAGAPEPDLDELVWTAAAARLILGPDVAVQVPPNLTPEPDDAAAKDEEEEEEEEGGAAEELEEFLVEPVGVASVAEVRGERLGRGEPRGDARPRQPRGAVAEAGRAREGHRRGGVRPRPEARRAAEVRARAPRDRTVARPERRELRALPQRRGRHGEGVRVVPGEGRRRRVRSRSVERARATRRENERRRRHSRRIGRLPVLAARVFGSAARARRRRRGRGGVRRAGPPERSRRAVARDRVRDGDARVLRAGGRGRGPRGRGAGVVRLRLRRGGGDASPGARRGRRRGVRGGGRAAPRDVRRRRELRREPQHQLHERVRAVVLVLRLQQRERARARRVRRRRGAPGETVPARPRGGVSARGRGVGARRDGGVHAGRDPPELHGGDVRGPDPRGQGGRAGHTRPRLLPARGDEGRRDVRFRGGCVRVGVHG